MCDQAADAARARQAVLTKPPGSLGALEEIAIRLAGLQGVEKPSADDAAILIFAGDHGVTARGVSPFPRDVTLQMLANFAAGGAAISVLARETGTALHVIDVGTDGDTSAISGIHIDKVRRGTADFSRGPAMSADDLTAALNAGARAVDKAVAANAATGGAGLRLLVLGEMGIGNTSAAAAIIAALTGAAPRDVTGPGTGLDAAGVQRKADVIAEALALHGLDSGSDDVHAVLRCVGGLELAALTAAMIHAAQSGIAILVDGFIVGAAALAASKLNPSVAPWLIFTHRSAEPGHATVLDVLDATPLLDLGLRLGEGSGAATALPLVRLACALHAGMATFEEAAVAGPK
ncbi:MAG: nicotinate-nucleotide--dimethylbenzimidazole phosphoribosyltransferase [Pseudomonadota bacterium]